MIVKKERDGGNERLCTREELPTSSLTSSLILHHPLNLLQLLKQRLSKDGKNVSDKRGSS
jgi:hypothetical protein